MSAEGITADWCCPECGRENRLAAERYRLCSAPKPGTTAVATAPSAQRPIRDEADEDHPAQGPPSYFHRHLPEATANLILIVCVLLIPAGGLGVALAVVLIPTLVRLARAADSRKAGEASQPLGTWFQSALVLLAATAIALLVVASAFGTFVAVCGSAGAFAFSGGGGIERLPIFAGGLVFGVLAACGVSYGIVFLFFGQHRPRVCPRCGGENAWTATICRFCRPPMSLIPDSSPRFRR